MLGRPKLFSSAFGELWGRRFFRELGEGADESALCAIGSVTNGLLASVEGFRLFILAGRDSWSQSGF